MTSQLPLPTEDQPLDPAAEAELRALARRMRRANGPLMRLVNFAGGQVENWLEALPDGAKTALEQATERALYGAYATASRVAASDAAPSLGRHGHKVAAMASGAAGGAGGLPTALIELPATVTLIFGAIQRVAVQHGYDPADEAVRKECIAVFGSGGPIAADDGVNTTFLSSRLMLNGLTVHGLIARISPRLSIVLAQKLGMQSVPVLGAVSGAAVNYAFARYFEEAAQVRFGVRRLADTHGEAPVMARFAEAWKKPALARK